MTVISNQTWIDRSPEEVFDYCVDIRDELDWNPTAVSMEKLSDGPVAVTFTGRVEPEDDGTRLLVSFHARPRGWFRMVFPVFVLMMKRQEKANMTHLREALETPAAPGEHPRTSR